MSKSVARTPDSGRCGDAVAWCGEFAGEGRNEGVGEAGVSGNARRRRRLSGRSMTASRRRRQRTESE